MEGNEIIKKIIRTDKEAEGIAKQAKDLESGLDRNTKDRINNLEQQLNAKMERRIEIVRDNYKQEADELIEQSNKEFEQNLERLEQTYAQNCKKWTDQLFEELFDKGQA